MRQDPIGDLVQLLARLPGIGERTAARLAFYILGAEPGYAHSLGESVGHIHERVQRCTQCGNYGAGPICTICADPRRDPTVLCVLGRVPDLMAMERSGLFRGRYYVLHGLLAPLEGIGPDQLPVDALLERVRQDGVREVIVATPLSVEGEATALYIAKLIQPLGVHVSRIASGLPHGGELEFTDQVTLGRALEGRRSMG
jgi:recombination protein RecR